MAFTERDRPAPMPEAPTTAFKAVFRILRHIQMGRITVIDPKGRSYVFDGPDPGPRAVVRVNRERMIRRVLTRGELGFGESYMDGDWDTPSVADVIELVVANHEALHKRFKKTWLTRLTGRLIHAFNRNSRTGSKRNILAHYDLGNRFYGHWLDPSMTYSAAVFEPGVNSLEAAQEAKYRRLCGLLDLKPGDRVLEIGCGWGGFAEVAARDYGAHVTGLTISDEQHDYAVDRMARAGLSDRVEIRKQDYRDCTGRFDKICSIEMFEAVGERYWPVYFQRLHDLLERGGRAALQIITIEEHRFDNYRRSADFIQRYIFPGGMLPSLPRLRGLTERHGLVWEQDHAHGRDYARTLNSWSKSFAEAWDNIRPLGFDEQFRRMWDFYLGYCEGGFRAGSIDVSQIALKKPT